MLVELAATEGKLRNSVIKKTQISIVFQTAVLQFYFPYDIKYHKPVI